MKNRTALPAVVRLLDLFAFLLGNRALTQARFSRWALNASVIAFAIAAGLYGGSVLYRLSKTSCASIPLWSKSFIIPIPLSRSNCWTHVGVKWAIKKPINVVFIGFFGVPGGILTLACGLAQGSALNAHRAFIHYRPQFESSLGAAKKETPHGGLFFWPPRRDSNPRPSA